MVVVRPCLVTRNPGRQRLRRLGPVDEGKRDQREPDDDGDPDEQAIPLHRPSLIKVARTRRFERAYRLPSSRDLVREGLAAVKPRRGSARKRPSEGRPLKLKGRPGGRPLSSPSRFRFRPPAPLTFGFRLLPSLPASTYLRSVLGANGNLGEPRSFRKRSERRKGRNLQKFNFPHFHSRPCSLWKASRPRRRRLRCRPGGRGGLAGPTVPNPPIETARSKRMLELGTCLESYTCRTCLAHPRSTVA
jgi:hypothetical protein